jgi:DNA invertase Pin-like site-specific DNA recombinase
MLWATSSSQYTQRLFRFLEQFCNQAESPIKPQNWNVYLEYAPPSNNHCWRTYQFSVSRLTAKENLETMKKIAIYVRVSSPDQHVESQLYDLRELAAQRGFEVVHEYEDRGVCGQKARRPGLDAMMRDARRKKFSVVLVAAFDRIARSTKNFLQIVDELDSLGIEFISRREGVATGDAMGRLFVTIISAIAELERSLVVERVKSGMRRAKLEGRQIGRARLDINREQVVCDRRNGMSLTQVAKQHNISRASVCRLMKEANSNSTVVIARLSEDVANEARL